MNEKELIRGRERLLEAALERFVGDPAVVGVFLGGSLAARSADEYSDIDLRVAVGDADHSWFVEHRREITKSWPGFLFNEWMPGAQHCVSHFRPFNKIDIFYYAVSALKASPWYGLPIRILHDPRGVVARLLEQSKGLPFTVSGEDVDYSISKGIAAAHEAYRRTRRGELFYAQTLLDELRHHIMQADDWLHGRTPSTAVFAKFDRRGSAETLGILSSSYCGCEADAMIAALLSLAGLYRGQITRLHEQFELSRPLAADLDSIDIVLP